MPSRGIGAAEHVSRRALVVVVVMLFAACSSGTSSVEPASLLTDEVITVGSFDFAESVVVAEVYSQGLEAAGYKVRRAFDLGPREFVGPALSAGLVEFVPEYAGTAAEFYSLDRAEPTDDVGVAHSELVRALAGKQVVALAAAPAQDANTFVVTAATASRLHLKRLSDLQTVDDQLTFGGPPECRARALCLVGLADTYGLTFGEVVTLDTGGPVTRGALKRGLVDVALMFTTDPAIVEDGLVELDDDRGLEPAENITPLVRTELVDRWGADFVAVIDAVSARLTTVAVRELNAKARVERGYGGRRVGVVVGGEVVTASEGLDPITDTPVVVAEPPSFVPPTVRRTRRVRRPSGAPPPLPRSLGRSGRGWIVALVVLIVWMIVTLVSPWARRVTDEADAAVLRGLARLRTDWLMTLARGVDRLATGWTMFFVAMILLIVTIVFRRWRHLFTFVGGVMVLIVIGSSLIAGFKRPRPYDVTMAGRWQGFSFPSAAVAIVSFTAVGVIYMTVVPGRPRQVAKLVGAVAVAMVAGARLYLGIDHPSDVLVGAALSVAILLTAFRFFTPNEAFPVTYRRGKTAHLDVEGRRGEAIRKAVEEQLGVTVVELRPVGLAGSGGSTPLRLRVAGDPDTYLFGKLYAMNHVRADRWYKLGRTILYGRLEDEKPFQSVRRLVQYEDYALRIMRDAGVPTAAALGVVELTPEREYLLVTGFFDGAVEIGEAEVDDQVIDEGLALIRRLWNNGLAHRDIKPANLLVSEGHLVVIDVAFAQVRPSPWREAVDLANMMLVLGVRTDAERVYRRALTYFTPDEIAEAFAAARGVASPSQLRSMMKSDGRDLVAQFRALAPARRPISLQRWGPRRVLLAAALVAITALSLAAIYQVFTPAELPIADQPSCGTGKVMILMAQAVPTATAVPCVAALPAGWSVGEVSVRNGSARFWLDSDQAGRHALEVTLRTRGTCVVDGATEVVSEEVGLGRFEQPSELPPALRTVRMYVADGECVTYRFTFGGNTNASAIVVLDTALAFQPRDELVREVDRVSGLVLCGVGAPPCTGATG